MKNKKTSVTKLVQYENNELNTKEMIELFQELINTGLAWQLQGHYGRTAKRLIEEGHCNYKKETN